MLFDGLDHPVSDGVGQAGLEPVEGLTELSGHLVVDGEPGEGGSQGVGAAVGERDQRLRQGEPGAHGRGEVVDRVGPDVSELALATSRATPQHSHRCVAGQRREDRCHRERPGDHQTEQQDGHEDPGAEGEHAPRGDLGESGLVEQSPQSARPVGDWARRRFAS